MKLATKISLAMSVLTLLILLIGVFGILQMRFINAKSTIVSEEWLPAIVAISSLNTLFSDIRIAEIRHVYSEDDATMQEFESQLENVVKDFGKNLNEFRAIKMGEEEKVLLQRFLNFYEQYTELNKKILDLSRQKKTVEAVTLLEGASMQAYKNANETLLQLVNFNIAGGKSASKEGNEAYLAASSFITGLLVFAALLAVVITWFIVTGTRKQLGKDPAELALLARRVENGDLSIEKDTRALGVYAAILRMVENLKKNIEATQLESEHAKEESIKAQQAMEEAKAASANAQSKTERMLSAADRLEEIANVVSSASAQLSAQIEQSERGAAEQASRTAETATAMEEMNATVLEVAKNASTASDFSATTRQQAETGADIVRKAVKSIQHVQQQSLALKADMHTLEQHAQSISQIMGVISDIADQTNLLALNAAIEAARAGDAGRGFAVVADEVRKLAEKTMTSTTDVGNAIQKIQRSTQNSMQQVDSAVQAIEEATEFASQSGTALQEIVSMVDNTADQVRAIATASEEQSATSDSINRSVSMVNSIAGETARAMQEAAQAVSDLSRQTQMLGRLIDEMKV